MNLLTLIYLGPFSETSIIGYTAVRKLEHSQCISQSTFILFPILVLISFSFVSVYFQSFNPSLPIFLVTYR